MKALFWQEIKQNRRTAIIWIISLTSVAALYMLIFPAFADAAETVNKIYQSFPLALRKAFGLNFDPKFALASFYALVLGFTTLAAAIQAMNLGTASLSKEERGKTAEFLLSKPIKRSSIVSAKLAAAVVVIAGTNVVFVSATWTIMMAVSKVALSTSVFLLMSLTLLFVQIFFVALGFLISVSAKRIKNVLSVSLVTVFAFYIVGMFDAVLGAKAVRYLTPFKFFDLIYVYKHGSYEWQYPLIEIMFVIAAVAAGYYIYSRRDISSI
ncbi:MAG: ABC transporter permease subunit [Actinomycetota bacterium]